MKRHPHAVASKEAATSVLSAWAVPDEAAAASSVGIERRQRGAHVELPRLNAGLVPHQRAEGIDEARTVEQASQLIRAGPAEQRLAHGIQVRFAPPHQGPRPQTRTATTLPTESASDARTACQTSALRIASIYPTRLCDGRAPGTRDQGGDPRRDVHSRRHKRPQFENMCQEK